MVRELTSLELQARIQVQPTSSMITFITLRTLILQFFLLITATIPSIAFEPHCDLFYGQPIFNSCYSLLRGDPITFATGLSSIDRRDHLFALPGHPRPRPGVGDQQWRNRVSLPIFLANRKYIFLSMCIYWTWH